MQKPNVLFISSWYPSREHATLGNFVQRHAEAINPFVNLFVVCAVSSETIDDDIENNQINSVNTTIVYYKKVTHSIPLIANLIKLKRYKNAYQKGIQFIENQFNINKWDVTHCNVTFPAGLIALDLKKKRNIPYVITEHWTMFLSHNNGFKKLSPFKRKAIKEIVSNANKMAPVSYHLRNSMKELGLKGSYIVIPNVVDVNRFELKRHSDREIKNILHVSTLEDEQKNISDIFRVLNAISKYRSDFKLVIVSDGDIEKAKELQKIIGLNSNLVEYHSTKTPDEIAEFYRDSDFLLLFSNYETFSVVIAEAWCCGLPVVSSKCGGLTDEIEYKMGVTVTPKNTTELEEAIVNMLDDLDKYDSKFIRKNAISRFDNKVVGEKYLSLYKEMIG